MKSCCLTVCALFMFAISSAQTIDVAGLWKGSLYNDTTRKNYNYQLVISDDGGKLSGYSYIVYDIDGKPETAVRTLKIKRKGDQLTITDDDLIYNNYSEAPPKGIHKVSIVNVVIQDTVMLMQGEWHTNRTKKYLPLSGTFSVKKRYDYKEAELFKKLEDLNLTAVLSFIPKIKSAEQVTEPVTKAPVKKENVTVAVKEKKKTEPVKENKQPEVKPVVTVEVPPAADVSKRKIINTQEVIFKSDSLTISLFDNGDVDGDVVTLLMNNAVIMPKVSLTSRGTRKTIYFDQNTPDTLLLVMFAENLGSIPPNTGLLVVNDGSDIYELRFSADLQTNAAILLRRKKQ